MTTYTTAPNRTLEKDDSVIFRVGKLTLHYKVATNHLHCTDRLYSNEHIFRVLGIEETKHARASKAYGYPSTGGLWPCAEDGDYAALTRLVKGLFARIAGKRVKGFTPKPKKFTAKHRGKAIAKYLAKNRDAFGCQRDHVIELLSILTGTDIGHHMVYGGK